MKSLSDFVRITLLAVLLAGTVLSARSVPSVHALGSVIRITDPEDRIANNALCSLREAITNANHDETVYPDCVGGSGNDTIIFTNTVATIYVEDEWITITDPDGLTIDGSRRPPIAGGFRVEVELVYADRAFYVDHAPLTLDSLEIWGGNSHDVGGAVYNDGGALTVNRSLFSSNEARYGGGAIYSESGTLIVANSIFYQNIVLQGEAGAIRSSGTTTLTNNTFAQNLSELGGDIYLASGTANLTNNILADNILGGNCVRNGAAVVIKGHHNLIEDPSTACGFIHGVEGNLVGVDPVFAPSSGYVPTTTSPAIDAGDDEACANGLVNNTSYNSVPRPKGPHCDIGAYEKDRFALGKAGDIPVPADYNGDGTDELAVYQPSSGFWYIQDQMAIQHGQINSDIPVPADYNGDHKTDIAVFRPSDGTWRIYGQAPSTWGTLLGDRPVPADYNGDEQDEIAIFRPSTGSWYIHTVGEYHQYGTIGDIPVPADYTGDGHAEIAVFRPSNGYWYIYGQAPVLYGTVVAGDIPVPADYNGDHQTDIALFRPSNSMWYVRNVGEFAYGQVGDIPVPADYNGDDLTDIAVFRPSDGTWHILGVTPD